MRFAPALLTGLLLLSLLLIPGIHRTHAQDDQLKSRPELTNYEETSRYEDVMRFFTELQKRSPLVKLETFGQTVEGRAMPLVILSTKPIAQPSEAKASGKPIVFLLANIHGGEVEGKEAVQHLARRLALGDLRPMLDKLIVLIAPIYNADGNEKIRVESRWRQNGPIGGVGARENSKGLDLNRDYSKLDSPEAQALVGLFNRWDPHVMVDLHTTDGTVMAFHLTYSIPLNPTIDPRIMSYHRDKLMPAVADGMLKNYQFRSYYYGNASGPAPKPGEPEKRTWRNFIPQPRAGQNYYGFRNRLTILSEAYTHLSFKRRVEVTTALVEETFKYTAAHGAEIIQLLKQVDADTIKRGQQGPPLPIGVEYQQTPLPQPVTILLGETTTLRNPRSDRDMIAMVEDKINPVQMQDFGLYAATRTVPAARAYLIRKEEGTRAAIDKLRQHGITVEELTAPLTTEVESFVIGEVKRAERPNPSYGQHREVTLKGQYKKETVTFPAGSIIVRFAQPLGTLAAFLLEPESDDGLTHWNFFDAYLEVGKAHPVSKVMQNVKATSKPVAQK